MYIKLILRIRKSSFFATQWSRLNIFIFFPSIGRIRESLDVVRFYFTPQSHLNLSFLLWKRTSLNKSWLPVT